MPYGVRTTIFMMMQVVLHDLGPVEKHDPNTRHIAMPGTANTKVKGVEGFSCRSFVGYTETQTFINLIQGDTSCSGEVVNPETGAFREVNYLPTPSGSLPVVIHSPRGLLSHQSKLVIFITGGPRNIAVTRPLTKRLVAAGYTVLMPIYLGALETRHPDPDLPEAVEQVRALSRWSGNRLVAMVGVSTGAYIAAAACIERCPLRILLAPPLTTPAAMLSDQRVDWTKFHNGYCLWRQNGPSRVCADDRPFITSFWGSYYYRRSLSALLAPSQCSRVRIIVSPQDQRVYDPSGVAELRATGCEVETPHGYAHWQIDANSKLNNHTVELISKQEDANQAASTPGYLAKASFAHRGTVRGENIAQQYH